MKTLPLLLVVLLAACAPKVHVKSSPGNERLRVAVVPFADAPGAPGSGELARLAFATNILSVDAYDVLDRAALDQVLAEQKLGLTGAVDASKAVELGKLLGADAVIVGSVTEFKHRKALMFPPAKVSLNARMIDTKTGLVEWSAEHRVGGTRRWLSWAFVVMPVIPLYSTIMSPTAEDQVSNAAADVCKKLDAELKKPLGLARR